MSDLNVGAKSNHGQRQLVAAMEIRCPVYPAIAYHGDDNADQHDAALFLHKAQALYLRGALAPSGRCALDLLT